MKRINISRLLDTLVNALRPSYVFEFQFTDLQESMRPQRISLHYTKQGAREAIKAHKLEEHKRLSSIYTDKTVILNFKHYMFWKIIRQKVNN